VKDARHGGGNHRILEFGKEGTPNYLSVHVQINFDDLGSARIVSTWTGTDDDKFYSVYNYDLNENMTSIKVNNAWVSTGGLFAGWSERTYATNGLWGAQLVGVDGDTSWEMMKRDYWHNQGFWGKTGVVLYGLAVFALTTAAVILTGGMVLGGLSFSIGLGGGLAGSFSFLTATAAGALALSASPFVLGLIGGGFLMVSGLAVGGGLYGLGSAVGWEGLEHVGQAFMLGGIISGVAGLVVASPLVGAGLRSIVTGAFVKGGFWASTAAFGGFVSKVSIGLLLDSLYAGAMGFVAHQAGFHAAGEFLMLTSSVLGWASLATAVVGVVAIIPNMAVRSILGSSSFWGRRLGLQNQWQTALLFSTRTDGRTVGCLE